MIVAFSVAPSGGTSTDSVHDAVAAVTRLAQQLRLDIHVPATEAPPDDPDP